MTNLHLGSQRGDWAALAAALGPPTVARLEDLCRRAAAAFPQSLYAGLDVLIEPHGARLAILEANAFGDLLPGISHAGMDTYSAELDAALQRWEEAA
jgi:D-alanine-D-alanine ligase-like ATP-grasp enzyme